MIKTAKYNEEGKCPVCGSEQVSYIEGFIEGDGYVYKANCDDCAAYWDEWYDLKFAGNWNVYDKDGNEYRKEEEE